MNIAFVVDENYAVYIYVAISSILHTKNIEDKLSFFVFTPDISDISKNEILKLKTKYNTNIIIFSINNQ